MAKHHRLYVCLIFLLVASCYGSDNKAGTKDSTNGSSATVDTRTTPSPDDFGDVYISGSIGDASNLIPYLSGDSASSEVQGMVYSGLLKLDKDQNLIPDLAKSYEISEDQLTITFHLRNDVKWHDGAPWTANDLIYQYEMMIHDDVPSAYKESFMQIATATAPDDHTFVVTYDQPYSPALTRLSGMGGLPRHLLKNVKPVDLIKSKLARNPVGNGAWVFNEWKAQTRIVVDANDNHFDGRPMMGKAVTKIIPDTATQFLELKSGAIDTMALRPLQYLKQTDSRLFKENYVKYKYLSNGYTYLGYNLRRPMFQDKKVRQALTYAIDKNEVIEGVLLGLGQPATGPYKPGTWAYKSDVKKYRYDPNKAKALLAEAGWRDSDGDGILDKDGKKFEFEIITNQGNNLRSKTAEIIQQKLKKIGVVVNVRIIEWSAFINNFINKRDFDACILGWSLGLDPDVYQTWHSSKTSEHEFNFISYNNPEVDDILEKARRTFDKNERIKYYHRFQDILAEEQPYTFLYVAEALPIVAKRIRGIDPGPAGIGYNFDKWWVPKTEHKRSLTE